MKTILFVLIFSPFVCLSQSSIHRTAKGNPIKYDSIVIDSSKTKEQLYSSARSWFNKSFKTSKEVVQLEDKESGELAGKGSLRITKLYKASLGVTINTNGYASFSVRILVKDGKYKYEFEDFEYTNLGASDVHGTITEDDEYTTSAMGKSVYNREWKAIKEDISNQINSLIALLKKTMSETSDF